MFHHLRSPDRGLNSSKVRAAGPLNDVLQCINKLSIIARPCASGSAACITDDTAESAAAPLSGQFIFLTFVCVPNIQVSLQFHSTAGPRSGGRARVSGGPRRSGSPPKRRTSSRSPVAAIPGVGGTKDGGGGEPTADAKAAAAVLLGEGDTLRFTKLARLRLSYLSLRRAQLSMRRCCGANNA